MKKIVASTQQYLKFIPHFPELDEEKLRKFQTAKTTTRRIRQKETGRHIVANVLTPPPILCCPHGDSLFILNGKHRLTVAALLGSWLVEVVIPETISDIEHGLSPKWLGGMTVEQICNLFINKNFYVDLCRTHGITKLLHLWITEREKIVRVFGSKSASMHLINVPEEHLE